MCGMPKSSISPAVDRAEVEQALDQRRLAGAVHAGETQKLAGCELQIDAAQHFGLAEALADAAHADDWVCHGTVRRAIVCAHDIGARRRTPRQRWLRRPLSFSIQPFVVDFPTRACLPPTRPPPTPFPPTRPPRTWSRSRTSRSRTGARRSSTASRSPSRAGAWSPSWAAAAAARRRCYG